MRAPSPTPTRARRSLRVFALLAGAALAASALAVGSGGPARAASSDPVVLGAPAYFPTDIAGQWTKLLNQSGMKHIVVNDTSLADAAVRGYVDQAKTKGIASYAYVSADYAPTGANGKTGKPAATLKADIAAKMALSASVGGIFIDEVLNNIGADCATPAAYYRDIYQWFKATYPGKTLVLNPGTALCSAFSDTADIFLFYESNRDFYYSAFKPYLASSAFDWIRALPNERVWMIMYGVSAGTFQQDVNDMASVAGIVWIDPDLSVATVYDQLPDATLLGLLAARAVPTVSSPATIATVVVAGGATTTTVPAATFPPVSTFPPLQQLPGPVPTTVPLATTATLPVLQAPASSIRLSVTTKKVTTTTKRKATTRKTTKKVVRR